ncbi:MAG: hypothetical protein ACI4TJ_06900 [Candidatus Cryptobacteroides sp.]
MRRLVNHTVIPFLAVSLLALSFGAGAVSCGRKVEERNDFSPFVKSLLDGSMDELHRLASLSGRVSGSIAVIGTPPECSALSAELSRCDIFDNIDGSTRPDGLPDFAGERIVAVLDSANLPYKIPSGEAGRDFSLSEIAVRNVMAVMDADIACKVIIICSPLLAEYCSDEIRNFLTEAGADVPVVASAVPGYSYAQETFRLLRNRNAFTHAISYPELKFYKTVRPDPTGSSFILEECPVAESDTSLIVDQIE